MAIGTIAVLLILVSSLAMIYIRETKLSRYSYDDLIASTNAEGMFEYAMLKVRNHRDGFQDSVDSNSVDGKILATVLPRSTGLQSEYTMTGSSTDTIFTVIPGQHLILPLFASDETLLTSGNPSKKPNYNTSVKKVSNLNISWIWSADWTIVAMSGSESVALTGSGDISPWKEGTIRIRKSQCYSRIDGSEIAGCIGLQPEDEEIVYFYDVKWTVKQFLEESIFWVEASSAFAMTTIDPYLVFYNATSSDIPVRVTATTSFSLPTLSVRTSAKKWNSSQIYQFTEDKSRYYDALKYGIYNTGP